MRSLIAPQVNLISLAQRIQPQEGELAAAQSHRASVRLRLAGSFETSSAPLMGSHARGTAVRRYSDLDMLLVLRKQEAIWGGRPVSSDRILQRVQADLRERYRFTTVRRDVLAVAIDFGDGKHGLDLVPGIFSRFANARPVYWIPDGEGGWLETSPATHDRYFALEQARSGNKLSRVSQLVKWWKHARDPALPLGSFYVDMLLAGEGVCLGAKTYAQCLCEFFEMLVRRKCSGYVDPCGIAGRIAASNTAAQREVLQRTALYALEHARSALAAEARRHHEEANRQWNLVFNATY
ncbi:MAG TPA: hypothetical protein PLW72_07925 [Burkholderiaceae bacterium]|nr:hypothetical protein [Burkholderiaceae bacterium]